MYIRAIIASLIAVSLGAPVPQPQLGSLLGSLGSAASGAIPPLLDIISKIKPEDLAKFINLAGKVPSILAGNGKSPGKDGGAGKDLISSLLNSVLNEKDPNVTPPPNANGSLPQGGNPKVPPFKPSPTPGPGNNKVPGEMVDDYPYKRQCGPSDEYSQRKCQCTSFVAWRIVDRLGIDFSKYDRWGDAKQWDNNARNNGLVVNNTPVPGSIAQTDNGLLCHVAWVSKVNGNQVTIEDYNGSGGTERYGVQTVPASNFRYIHLT